MSKTETTTTMHAVVQVSLAKKCDVLCTLLGITRSELVRKALEAEVAAVEQLPEAKMAFRALESFQSTVAARGAKK